MDVPQAIRIERPNWLNARTVLGLLLFTTALLGGQRVMESAASTTAVWMAAKDLPADSVIAPGDVRLAHVALPSDVIGGYLTAEMPVEGAVLGRPVFSGELLTGSSVWGSATATSGRSMTIPVSIEHALGGTLRPGERVDVYVTFGAGQVEARTELLLAGAEILDVVTGGDLAFGGSDVLGFTVTVTAEEAPDVAFAIRNGEIDLVRLSGEVPPATDRSQEPAS